MVFFSVLFMSFLWIWVFGFETFRWGIFPQYWWYFTHFITYAFSVVRHLHGYGNAFYSVHQ